MQKVDLVRKVVNCLRDQIIAEQFEPNGLMPAEGELCEIFSVSRTVIREAMLEHLAITEKDLRGKKV